MEEQERIRRLAERSGLTEEEARVFDALITLGYYWQQLPDRDLSDNLQFRSSYDRIGGMLALRVVSREHHESWRTVGDVEDERESAGDEGP